MKIILILSVLVISWVFLFSWYIIISTFNDLIKLNTYLNKIIDKFKKNLINSKCQY
jgi:hypothetical protein